MTPDILDPPLHPPAAETSPRRLSMDLNDLLAEAAGRSLTIGELEAILQGRGFALFILLFSLPFCAPIAIPMLSIPFGVVIMFLGLRIALGRKPSLPAFILSKRIDYSVLERIIRVGLKLCKWMEKIAKPRMHFLQRWPGMINLIGLGIASGGVQLLLPLPPLIPLSNTLPALSVVLLTAGLIERDGVFVVCGYVLNITAWIYFAVMFVLLGDGVRHLFRWFGG